jgi:CspA family cold shock protein
VEAAGTPAFRDSAAGVRLTRLAGGAGERSMNGTIKKLVGDRGFGFITAENGTDYFFHRDQLQGGLDFDRLKPGDSVTFETQQGPKGPRAVDVRSA